MFKQRWLMVLCAAYVLAGLGAARTAQGAEAKDVRIESAIRVDVPVMLEKADVVFNMDHLAFNGDLPIGIKYMDLLAKRYLEWHTKGKIIGIFHGPAAYLVLNDKAYNAYRHIGTGNPYKELVAGLIRQGVQIEECGFSMKTNSWGNADLLPGVKVDTGAIGRLIELVQQGYVQIQP
jgi:intracellular sulfur oxidation DsrE/DsrF family protein